MSRSKCDRCGETVADIDAGFSPGMHEMRHECGGTWRVVDEAAAVLARLRAAAEGAEPIDCTGLGTESEADALRDMMAKEKDPAVRARMQARLDDVLAMIDEKGAN